MAYTLGLDYGTNSVRALLVDTKDGREIASAVYNYPSGKEGILLDPGDPNLARQHPGDYLSGLESTVCEALATAAKAESNFDPGKVAGIGVDTTGSSPIPVDAANRALGMEPQFKDNLAAQCWLWKDHTSHAEAARITELARQHRPQYMAKCGNTYSSEWWWSKIWHCLKTAPDVFEAAASWVELSDWVPAVLAGITDPKAVKRSVCAAGHKAMYSDEWGGLPDAEFLGMLDPGLASLRDNLFERAYDVSVKAGDLCAEWADKLGLRAGIPIAVGAFDAHLGAVGSGVGEGVLVKIMGTSTCDCAVTPESHDLADIPGICGIVRGSILPGHYGLEAGQSAVGDIFKWWVEGICEGDGSLHGKLTEEASRLKPGESGLLALDWNNGNRTILTDPQLTGLLLGQTLHTTRAEVYRALVEATAFGARAIIERLEEYGVSIQQVVCCGGIAEKNAMVMQIYADITGRPMHISRSAQTCALGSAIAAAVVAGEHPDFATAVGAMTGLKDTHYTPEPRAQAVYDELYAEYRKLHDGFGGVNSAVDLGPVMKHLLAIRSRQRGG